VCVWLSLLFEVFGPTSEAVKSVVQTVGVFKPAPSVITQLIVSPASIQTPTYLLILLGCYALYCVGWALFVFGDPGTAAADLAKVDSKRR